MNRNEIITLLAVLSKGLLRKNEFGIILIIRWKACCPEQDFSGCLGCFIRIRQEEYCEYH